MRGFLRAYWHRHGSPQFNLAARIEGRVFRTGGELIGIATVRTTVFLKGTGCGSEPLAPPFEVETDEEGGYAQSLTFSGNDEFDACLTIEAIPPPGSELRPSSTVREIEIRPLNEGIQTIRVDFELAP